MIYKSAFSTIVRCIVQCDTCASHFAALILTVCQHEDIEFETNHVVSVCRPFSVSPQTASVDVGALLQVDVTYKPTCNSSHLADLLVKYSIGR